jgi:hypothetical protein
MRSVLAADMAILGKLQPLLQGLFVLVRMMGSSLTNRTFQLDHVVLRHRERLIIKLT